VEREIAGRTAEGGMINRMNTDQEKDYCKDGLCTADIFQEKDCAGFKSMAGSGTCLHQGLGFACEAEEGRNER
jgi:hypothetical protein